MDDLRSRLVAMVAALPDSASVTLPVVELRAWLADDGEPSEASSQASEPGWRAWLWTCPPETRFGVRELCEAIGRSPDFVYRSTSQKAALRLPHRKLGGELVFTAGEVRRWLQDVEAEPVGLTQRGKSRERAIGRRQESRR